MSGDFAAAPEQGSLSFTVVQASIRPGGPIPSRSSVDRPRPPLKASDPGKRHVSGPQEPGYGVQAR